MGSIWAIQGKAFIVIEKQDKLAEHKIAVKVLIEHHTKYICVKLFKFSLGISNYASSSPCGISIYVSPLNINHVGMLVWIGIAIP